MFGEEKQGNFGFAEVAVILLLFLNFGVWRAVLSPVFSTAAAPEVYFLDVGQGDAQLLILPRESGGKVKILIDAGRNRKVVEELDRALGFASRKYMDILVLTHADLDHYGGFSEVLKRYDVGAFVYNGIDKEGADFENLKKLLEEKSVPIIALKEGARIDYMNNRLSVISPDDNLISSPSLNEASLVILYDSKGARRANYGNYEEAEYGARVLFAGDIGFPAEEVILGKGYDISADILKVAHHGSKFSSGLNFVHAVGPKLAVIGVGQNRYGHPAPEALATLKLAGAQVYRTNLHGTVKITLD